MEYSRSCYQAIELIELLLAKTSELSLNDAVRELRNTFNQIFFTNNDLKEIYNELFPIEKHSFYYEVLDCIRSAIIFDEKFIQSFKGPRVSKETLIECMNDILCCLKEEKQHKIFYSWQSDIDKNTNRNFIEAAIKKAIKEIYKEENILFVLDKDTSERAGSPDIVNTILEKIKNCYLFISDVSLINDITFKDNRKIPNPNVMYETGFAQSVCGAESIILVHNLYTGAIIDLPFDVRGKRILTYECGDSYNEDQRQQAKKELILKIKNAIMTRYNLDHKK